MTEKINGQVPNSFKIRSWGDLYAVAGFIVLCFGIITWGLKLESRIDSSVEKIQKLEVKVEKGILSRAEERIDSLGDRVDKLESRKQ